MKNDEKSCKIDEKSWFWGSLGRSGSVREGFWSKSVAGVCSSRIPGRVLGKDFKVLGKSGESILSENDEF
jgi:hypothetical protein